MVRCTREARLGISSSGKAAEAATQGRGRKKDRGLRMATKIKVRLGLGLSFLRVGLTAGLLMVLLTGTLAAQQKPEDIPDAPSATRPIPPPDAPSPRPGVDDANIPLAPPADNSDSGMSSSNGLPHSSPDSTGSNSVPPPMPPVKTVWRAACPRMWERVRILTTPSR